MEDDFPDLNYLSVVNEVGKLEVDLLALNPLLTLTVGHTSCPSPDEIYLFLVSGSAFGCFDLGQDPGNP